MVWGIGIPKNRGSQPNKAFWKKMQVSLEENVH
jgi:hypothetical protein